MSDDSGSQSVPISASMDHRETGRWDPVGPEGLVGPEPGEADTPGPPTAAVPTPEPAPESEVAQAAEEVRTVPRVSMREELLALFKDTEREPTPAASEAPGTLTAVLLGQPEPSGAPASTPGPASMYVPAQSIYLQRFLRAAPRAADLSSLGIPELDATLGGGLGPGLHVLAGPAGAGKTTFMLSALWEALSVGRPALYYAFREGSLRTWMRLIATLASFQGGPAASAITLTRLRSGQVGPEHMESLARLDRLFQASILPLLSLVDAFPARSATLDAFTDDMRARSLEVAQKHGRMPLVLVDDIDRLLLVAPERPLLHALAVLDEILRDEYVPAIGAAHIPESLLGAADALPAQTVLILGAAMGTREDGFGRAALEVQANATTGWTGTLPLLVDFSSGLFAADPAESTETSPK